jgi:NADPH-dependent curcumin reductase CurA
MNVGKQSYFAPFTLHAPMNGGGVATVIKSTNADFPVGTVVLGSLPWQDFILFKQPETAGLTKISVPSGIPSSYFLGVLGMPGMTAYYGLIKIGVPKAGETLYVSAAAGAVGLIVCQIGKILGLRVVASAGTDEKVEYLKTVVGVDAAFNYKNHQGQFHKVLKDHCSNGIDIVSRIPYYSFYRKKDLKLKYRRVFSTLKTSEEKCWTPFYST